MTSIVGIVFGGKSGEHDVSVSTAFSVFQQIDLTKFSVLPIYITREGVWECAEAPYGESLRTFSSLEALRSDWPHAVPHLLRLAENVDVFFPLIHGTNGEDGTLQGLFELLNVPYVGSGVLGSAVGMDKSTMKKVFDSSRFPQGKFLSFTQSQVEDGLDMAIQLIELELRYPCFVKPSNAGSSLGITKAKNREELLAGLDEAFRYDRKVVIEEHLCGRELEIGILGNGPFLTSAVGEVSTTREFYDYQAKYLDQEATRISIPADIPVAVSERMAFWAKRVCEELDCYGLSRVDFFWNEETDQLSINEINSIPGFTPHSMYPLLFQQAGIPYSDLIDRLLALALERRGSKRLGEVSL